tara:strand:- start:1006 stop:1641 length:636 start_codon:yes stop_codon:yes gene_type:complete
MRVAIFIDGEFFLRRIGSSVRDDAVKVADAIEERVQSYLKVDGTSELYRIFFYDCAPLKELVVNPISKSSVDLSKTEVARFRDKLHKELRHRRKIAVRLGKLSLRGKWKIRPKLMESLLAGKTISSLTEMDVKLDVVQKQVDMMVGIDIASVAFKRQAERVILIAGDADFVPAAKLARREGIDFILDSMHNPIKPELHEHIDGLWEEIASM